MSAAERGAGGAGPAAAADRGAGGAGPTAAADRGAGGAGPTAATDRDATSVPPPGTSVPPPGAASVSPPGAPAAPLEPPGRLRGALIVARFSLRESLRRRVFVVIALLTLVFLTLYGLATWQAFKASDQFAEGTAPGVDADIVVGATMAGLAMFATLFLGTILAVFLTLGAVRGDAERGLLQPLLVRPLPRHTLLLGRWLGATAVCAPYVMLIALASFGITRALGGWWPDRLAGPLLALALGVAIIAALSLAGSIVLASTANGIAVFMLFGAGLTAGLLGQIAEAISSDGLGDIANVASWALPFEALYQAGLAEITIDTVGFARLAIDLGPFGGAQAAGASLWLWSLAYLAAVGGAAVAAFARRDL